MRLKEPGAAYSSVHYSPPRAGGTLEALDLTRRFGDRTVVDEVSFRVEPGQMTGFVGANGAGKTTTMRMIMGVLNQHGGTVLWNGRPIDARARSRFGYMPEERGLYPKQRIADQLGYLGQLHGMERSRALTEAHRLLDRFGLGSEPRTGSRHCRWVISSASRSPRPCFTIPWPWSWTNRSPGWTRPLSMPWWGCCANTWLAGYRCCFPPTNWI